MNFNKSILGVFIVCFVLGIYSCNRNSYQINTSRLAYLRSIQIPTIDISSESSRQVIIAQGTEDLRQGHPSTILMPDGKTMFVIWTKGHGGPVSFFKKSTDGGLTWSQLMDVPDSWNNYANCPPLYLLEDPDGVQRLTTFVNRGPNGMKMYRAVYDEPQMKWSPFEPVIIAGSVDTLIADVMPFTAIEPVDGGEKLLGFTNIRRPYDVGKTNVLAQSSSLDGGQSWSSWRIILDLGNPYRPCEPEVIRSPSGNQLLMIIRENDRNLNSWLMISNNEGVTWSEPFQAPASVTMDRHQACYAKDGRLVIVGRDVAESSQTNGHFVAWVGTYEDLINGREGQYRVKLLHSYKTTEYPGLEMLPDGTFVATNSVSYRPNENYSVVSTRFTLEELDQKLKKSL
ncbi:MAG: sialidase family protein [Bacteroidota bacterium]